MVLWRARDVEILISTSSTASSVSDFSASTDYSGFFKTTEFKEPERSTGEQKLLGATDGNANSEVWEEDPEVAELTGDLLLTPKSGETVDISELFYTYTGSDPKEFNYASDPLNPSIFIKFSIGESDTNYVGFILTGVKLNSLGGTSVDADGHASSDGFKVTAAANQTRKFKGGNLIA